MELRSATSTHFAALTLLLPLEITTPHTPCLLCSRSSGCICCNRLMVQVGADEATTAFRCNKVYMHMCRSMCIYTTCAGARTPVQENGLLHDHSPADTSHIEAVLFMSAGCLCMNKEPKFRHQVIITSCAVKRCIHLKLSTFTCYLHSCASRCAQLPCLIKWLMGILVGP